jgi:hypothetical protein
MRKEEICPLIKKVRAQVSVVTSYFIESHYFSEVLSERRLTLTGRMPFKLEPPGRTRFYTVKHLKVFENIGQVLLLARNYIERTPEKEFRYLQLY